MLVKKTNTWVSFKNHPEPSTTAPQAKFDLVTQNTIPPPAGQVLSTEEESESDEASGWSF